MPHEYNITSTAKYLISVLLLSIILSVSAKCDLIFAVTCDLGEYHLFDRPCLLCF